VSFHGIQFFFNMGVRSKNSGSLLLERPASSRGAKSRRAHGKARRRTAERPLWDQLFHSWRDGVRSPADCHYRTPATQIRSANSGVCYASFGVTGGHTAILDVTGPAFFPEEVAKAVEGSGKAAH
jgi:hypothetical protein